MTLYFITSNEGKLAEAKKILGGVGFDVEKKDLDVPEIQADNLEEVVEFCLDWLKKDLEGGYFLEDSGLFIDALSGFPGVYSSYVYRTIGCDGILKIMTQNENSSFISRAGCSGREQPAEGERVGGGRRTATFQSCVGFVSESGGKIIINESVRGSIALEQRGSGGFGYDPIFIPSGSEKTFAEMSLEEKNSYSHRGRSIAKLAERASRLI